MPPKPQRRISSGSLPRHLRKCSIAKKVPDSPTGHPREYTRIDETFSLEVLKLVGDWILANGFHRKKSRFSAVRKAAVTFPKNGRPFVLKRRIL